MPKHIGVFQKLMVGKTIKTLNDPNNPYHALTVRERNRFQGTDEEFAMHLIEEKRKRLEMACPSYSMFREKLNAYNPYLQELPGRQQRERVLYVDRDEWMIYLRPGTDFDKECKHLFEAHFGTGFELWLIRHWKPSGKLKRIEAVYSFRSRVDIIWSGT